MIDYIDFYTQLPEPKDDESISAKKVFYVIQSQIEHWRKRQIYNTVDGVAKNAVLEELYYLWDLITDIS